MDWVEHAEEIASILASLALIVPIVVLLMVVAGAIHPAVGLVMVFCIPVALSIIAETILREAFVRRVLRRW